MIFLLLFYWNYSCYISVIPVELFNRSAYRREIQSSMYCATSYVTSKSLVRAPFETLYTLIFSSVVYWMAGLDPNPACFLLFILAAWLSAQCAVSFGYLTSAISPSFQVAMAIHIPVILPLFLTAGLFINAGTVPWYLVWCQWLSYYYYAFEVMCATQFYGEHVFEGCEGGTCPLNSGDEVLASLAFRAQNVWRVDIPMLVVLVVAYRCLALFVVYRRAK